ncbi:MULTISPECIES: hypothetical protein [Halolamina]|uniref:Uncharacterized protein n=1 Tax=Halolamina pelagica TaxID=699431 RepID=A0A1I5VNQ9_9EURY|nr:MULTISPECIES: hypothetical protein [Halolamina]NHX37839.1 hypothetical protein [Halolamina sp. R1-12]SFQ09208.1 hypothetical protein SAMN05216277_11913 [Halolamina pelagica]
MSTNATRPNKGSVTEHSHRTLPAYEWLGRDRNDKTHVLDRKRDVVHRIDVLAGERVAVYDLDAVDTDCRGNAIETYVDFVADGVGWVDRTFLNRDLFGRAV